MISLVREIVAAWLLIGVIMVFCQVLIAALPD
jgi:hypothetical protein